MTRGRHDNTALVITDHLRPDGHDRVEPVAARQVLDGVLARPTADRAALEHLRQTFERAESLAVLAPRLANLDTWIAEHEPPDRADELTRAEGQLRQAVERMKPSRLTRGGRDDRRHLEQLTARRDHLADAQGHRNDWRAEHAETLDYRQELAEQVADRRDQLGIRAAEQQPAHVVDLLGACPEDADQTARWIARASRIESYREEWDIDPSELQVRPTDRTQVRGWQDSVGMILDDRRFQARLEAHRLEPLRDRGLGIER